MTPPQHILDEVARRIQEASDAYRSLPIPIRMMSEDFYVAVYLAARYPEPLTWVATSTGDSA